MARKFFVKSKLVDTQGLAFGLRHILGRLSVIVDSSALPADAAKQSKQLPDGHNVTVLDLATLATAAKQLADNHNVTVSNPTADPETGLATSLKQLANDHDVNVSNMIPAVETGLATALKQLAAGHTVAIQGTATSGSQLIKLDDSTYALVCIDYEHYAVHAKTMFTVHYTQLVSDIGDKSIISFKTPSGNDHIHIIMAIASQDASLAYILEAPTITDNTGAPLTVFNRFRDGVLVPSGVIDTSQNPDEADQATFFTEATMGNVTGGTKLEEVQMIVGQGPRILGGSTRGTQEFILAEDTLYAFVIESLNNNANLHNIRLDWYEHAPNE